MSKRAMAFLVLLMWTAVLPMRGYAAQEGSIQIELGVTGVSIQLCRAGERVAGGYLLDEGLGGGFISEADVLIPELALWLAQEADFGVFGRTDSDGRVCFSGLEEGIYLVSQYMDGEDDALFAPFVTVLPWDGYEWNLNLSPIPDSNEAESPDTSDPGIILWSPWTMGLSAVGIWVLVYTKRRMIGKNQ